MFPMQPCRFPPGEVPNCTNLRPAAGEEIYKGLLVARTDDNECERTDTGPILGVAQGGPAMNGTINIAKADFVTEFLAHVGDGEGGVTDVEDTMIGSRMGIAEIMMDAGYAQFPSLLVLEEGGTLVEVTDVKPEINVAIFKFLPGAVQETPASTGG